MKYFEVFTKVNKIIAALLIVAGLTACGSDKSSTESTSLDIKSMEVVDVDSSQLFTEKEEDNNDFVYKIDSSKLSGFDVSSNLHWAIQDHLQQGKDIFLLKKFYELGDENGKKYQVELYDEKNSVSNVVYEIPDAYLVNEFSVGGDYLYWVENHYDENEKLTTYKIVQFDTKNSSTKELGLRKENQYAEICLYANDKYVTWYDSALSEDKKSTIDKITVFDVVKKDFCDMSQINSGKIISYNTRLPITDGCVTYFTVDEKNNVNINRTNISDKSTITINIGSLSQNKKIDDCFSTKSFIGWKVNDLKKAYYVYEIKTKKLYKIDADNILSIVCTDKKLYASYQNDKDCVKSFDFENFETKNYNLNGLDSLFLVEYDKDLIGVQIQGLDENGLIKLN
ncbi:hypothetical protein [Butyrivibrio sp. NC3005]|uniref:hypothetical protein n=1 Tax=Butyrivibrio sp. NC3005 TaxID=1280685 RepID=UPI0004218F2C|nr:hypothetical protein [Butyrivibrio sp. NC3005]